MQPHTDVQVVAGMTACRWSLFDEARACSSRGQTSPHAGTFAATSGAAINVNTMHLAFIKDVCNTTLVHGGVTGA